jgi:hypothetical protein
MGGGDTRAGGTNVKRLRKLDEFHSGGIYTSKKYRYLQTDARRVAALSGAWALALFVDLDFQTSPMVPAT